MAQGAEFIPDSAVEPKMPERGGIPEQRRRPTVKFQSDFALSHDVSMRLKRFLERPLSDLCSEAETHRFRCGRVLPRTSCPIATAESGFIATFCCGVFFGAAVYISLVQHPAAGQSREERFKGSFTVERSEHLESEPEAAVSALGTLLRRVTSRYAIRRQPPATVSDKRTEKPHNQRHQRRRDIASR